MRNLDQLAAQTAQAIVKDTKNFGKTQVDNLVTKTLGVLQENGVYAATLFLYSRSGPDEKIAPYVRKPLLELAADEVVPQTAPEDKADEVVHQPAPEDNAEKALAFVTKHISNDLDTLLLVKQVWEQTLIYTRYGAKAEDK